MFLKMMIGVFEGRVSVFESRVSDFGGGEGCF